MRTHPLHKTLLLTLLGLLPGLMGCTTTQAFLLRSQYRSAEEAFERGEYALAATRYESLSDRYPPGPQRELMIIKQASAHYTLNSYQEARAIFRRYLAEYPHGTYANDAQDRLRTIETLLAPDNPARQEALAEAAQDLGKLNRLLLEHPHDPAVMYAIGNLYWEMGNAEEAVRYYYRASETNAAYQEKALIKERMMVGQDGKPIPVTAEAIEQGRRERNPLVIFDLADYKRRDNREVVGGNERFYVVTGLVRNQGTRLLNDVRVEVTFFNQSRQVMDVSDARIGAIPPNSVRAFRVEAKSYENLYNIQSYACTARWSD